MNNLSGHASLKPVPKLEAKESKPATFISELRKDILKVAKEATNNYVNLLIERKIREIDQMKELSEEFGKLDQVLAVLQDIKAGLTGKSVNAELEREVLEKLKAKLG